MDIERHDGYGVVRYPPEIFTKQGLPNFLGLSAETVGASGLCMNLVIIPAHGSALAHCHQSETAIYVLKGRVRTRVGEGLAEEVTVEEGNFLFIGSMVWHQPINPDDVEAVAIVARNDAREQEHVILYEERERAAT
ncbi:MAG: cupin domain-containing protein [Chloroflexota bacterium]